MLNYTDKDIYLDWFFKSIFSLKKTWSYIKFEELHMYMIATVQIQYNFPAILRDEQLVLINIKK